MVKKSGIHIKNKNKNVINIKINADPTKRKKRQYKRKPKPTDDKGYQSYSMQPPTVIYQSQPLYQQPTNPQPIATRDPQPIAIREPQPIAAIEPHPVIPVVPVVPDVPIANQEPHPVPRRERQRVGIRNPHPLRIMMRDALQRNTLLDTVRTPDFAAIPNRTPETQPFSPLRTGIQNDAVETQLNPMNRDETVRPQVRQRLATFFRRKEKTPEEIEREKQIKNQKARERYRRQRDAARNLPFTVDMHYNNMHPEPRNNHFSPSQIIRSDTTEV